MGVSVLTYIVEVVYPVGVVEESVEGLEEKEEMVVDVVVGKDVMSAVVGAEVVSAEVETGSVEVMVVNGSSVVTSSEDSCTASYLNKSF